MSKKGVVVDCSGEVNDGIPKWTRVALEEKRLPEAVDGLLVLEKKCRNGEDHESGQKVAACIVELCYKMKDYEALKANLVLLSKRRGQLKQIIKAAVQTCIDCMASLTPSETKLKIELIEVLRTITEGKIYVENERARLTKQLADIREEEGKIKEASELMQEIQVETYGSMEKREKCEFILEQIRLCLDSKDNIRALILSDKISSKLLNDPAFQDIKLRYHKLMIRYHIRKENFVAICRAYLEIYHTPRVQEAAGEREKFLQCAVVFCALSPYDHEQSDLAHRLLQYKDLEALPSFKKLLQAFTTLEIIRWTDLKEQHFAEISRLELTGHSTEPLSRSSDDLLSSSSEGLKSEEGGSGGEQAVGEVVWETLHKRAIEHNVRVVAAHYARIHTARLCSILGLPQDDTEQFVSSLVASKTVFAKIDRSLGIISFHKASQPADQLNEWSEDVSLLLSSLERVSHLIQRENMVYKIA